MDDKDLDRKGEGPRWGARILGLQESNGWIMVEVSARSCQSSCDGGLGASSDDEFGEEVSCSSTDSAHAGSNMLEDSQIGGDLLVDAVIQPDTSDFECAICLDVFNQPLRLTCSHVFCRECTVNSAAERRTCPMCRAEMPDYFDPRSALVDIEIQEKLIRSVGGVLQSTDRGTPCQQNLHYGNRLELIPALKGNFDKQGRRVKQRKWTLFVELEGAAETLIQSVCFQFPPHMGNAVWVLMPPFRVSRLDQGQGEVPVQMIIIWQPWVKQPSLILEHNVSFGEGVSSKSVSVDLPRGVKERYSS